MLSRFSPSPIIAAFARGADMQPYANQLEECDDEQECDVATADASTARKRKLQQVSTQQTRVRVTAWMVTDEQINGKLGLFARTARQFPSDFRASQNANSNKAKNWWGQRMRLADLAKQKGQHDFCLHCSAWKEQEAVV